MLRHRCYFAPVLSNGIPVKNPKVLKYELICQAVIFDFDGVLIDSNDVYEKHWKIWADRNGIDFEQILAVHHGIPPTRTIGIVAPHLDAKTEAQGFVQLCENDLEGVKIWPGALGLLERIQGYPWAIATSSTRNMVMPRLRYLSLPVPAVLVTNDDVLRGKPAPDPYEKAARDLGLEPHQCLVIEDAPAGITAAKAAGATVIAVETTHDRADLQHADFVTEGLTKLEVHAADDHLYFMSK